MAQMTAPEIVQHYAEQTEWRVVDYEVHYTYVVAHVAKDGKDGTIITRKHYWRRDDNGVFQFQRSV